MDKILILYFCRVLHLLLKTTEFSLPHNFIVQKYVYKHTEKMLDTSECSIFLTEIFFFNIYKNLELQVSVVLVRTCFSCSWRLVPCCVALQEISISLSILQEMTDPA